jgi:acyl-CoA synthetase (AMP-forming)/AMP-acid ligase II
VRDVVVVPVQSPSGPVVGVVVEAEAALPSAQLRATAAQMRPPWLHPQVVTVIDRLPRLPSGKPDREACHAILRGARGWSGSGAV